MTHFSIHYNTVWGENLGLLFSGHTAPFMLHTTDGHVWDADIDLSELSPVAGQERLVYHYAVWRDGSLTRKEIGPRPHCLTPTQLQNPPRQIDDAWSDLRIAGTAVPLFSLRTEGSQGIGDFGDLSLFIDWCSQTGQRIVQLLPINDTTKHRNEADSYPYSAISIYALHPIYADLRQLPPLHTARAKAIRVELQRLNDLPQIDYPAVIRLKEEYLHLSYAQQVRRKEKLSADYEELSRREKFLAENRHWLIPYAAFCALRDKYATPCFGEWPEHTTFSSAAVEKFVSHNAVAQYYLWLQYQLHTQLLAATRHARQCGVLIKGDIPIGIDRHSVDAWQHPQLFHLDTAAGAPPDAFSQEGQNWQFPTYDWERMASDGYLWWRQRFRHMATYFDAYRIDHILGFFRIWQIPAHKPTSALLGQFSPALPFSLEEIKNWGLDEKMLDITGKDEGCTDVLFLPDHDGHGWHPRFGGYDTAACQALTPACQEAYRRLHDHYFYERNEQFWRNEALKKLPVLTSETNLLPCGEDLGLVPACVPDVMDSLKILSLQIERMPRCGGQRFNDIAHSPTLSVVTTGTHDMPPLRLWWEEDAALSQTYYSEVLHRQGTTPATATPELCRAILLHTLQSPAALCIMPLQDWLTQVPAYCAASPADERINNPANPHHYWRYRMKPTIGQLQSDVLLSSQILSLLSISGRIPN